MADEVRRLSARGCHAVSFTENPVPMGLPSLHTSHWDPFWAACEDRPDGRLHAHRILGTTEHDCGRRPRWCGRKPCLGQDTMGAALDLVFSDIFKKFPTFKFALSEGGIGWIPYFLDKIDIHYSHHKAWTGEDFGDRLPSQIFRERVMTCFIEDPTGIEIRDKIGIDPSPGSATTRTRTPRGRQRRRPCGRNSATSPTPTSTRSRTRTQCASTTSTRTQSARRTSAPCGRSELRRPTCTPATTRSGSGTRSCGRRRGASRQPGPH